jgi:YHS domain-containing protein
MLRGYDPVAYFKQGKAVRGKRCIWSTYNGVTYFFVSKTDKAEFDRNPKKFEPQYGGFCAYRMAREEQKKRQICQKMMSVGWMILVGTMIVLPSNDQASSLRSEKEL